MAPQEPKLTMRRLIADVSRWIPLEYNTGLRTLRIRIYDLIQDYMHWIPNLLRLVEGQGLTTLIFDLCLYMPSQVFGELWDDIAWLISETPRYASLQHVRFVHRGPLVMDAVNAALSHQFPLLRSRGILEVEDLRNLDLCEFPADPPQRIFSDVVIHR